MKKVFLLPFLFISMLSVAQNNYTVSPSNVLTVTAPYNYLSLWYINFTNISDSNIILKWKLINNDLVPGWDHSLCDYTTCYPAIPANTTCTMTPVPSGDDGFFALHVNPYSIPGTGIVRIYVYEEGKEAFGDTVAWVVTSTSTGIKEEEMQSSLVSIYPNPALNYVVIDITKTNLTKENLLTIYNAAGQIMFDKTNSGRIEKIDVSAWPKGVYFLSIRDKEKLHLRKTLVK